ncbi:MAG: hypothetical protein M1131_07940 [Actinobacteria bacterium]|nr:hypothetical protein [Actinomycetota bacterium]MCL6096039.1 hypothetical protein [Actinomycetota bacterium]
MIEVPLVDNNFEDDHEPAQQWDPLSESPDLEYLHHHWALSTTIPAQQLHLPSQPKEIVRFGFNRLLNSSLQEYLNVEQQLFASLVRLTDTLAKRVDLLEAGQSRLRNEVTQLKEEARVVSQELSLLAEEHHNWGLELLERIEQIEKA